MFRKKRESLQSEDFQNEFFMQQDIKFYKKRIIRLPGSPLHIHIRYCGEDPIPTLTFLELMRLELNPYEWGRLQLDKEKLKTKIKILESSLLWALKEDTESIPGIKKILINSKTQFWLDYEIQTLDNEMLKEKIKKLDIWLLWAIKNDQDFVSDIKNILINTFIELMRLEYPYKLQHLDKDELKEKIKKLDSWFAFLVVMGP